MGNIIMQSQPYPLSVTFNDFRQMTISPKESVIRSQVKGELTNFFKFCYFFKSSILNAFL